MKFWLIVGSLNALLAVLLGAFGAHGLKQSLSAPSLEVYRTAVDYHMWHALGLLAVALVAGRADSTLIHWAGALMLAGVVVFSGSLYLLSVTGPRWLGAITPIGGVALLVAWGLVAIAAWRGL